MSLSANPGYAAPFGCRALALLGLCLLLCVIFLFPQSGASAAGNPFICKELKAKRQMLAREPAARELNFMLFDAVQSGCTKLMQDLIAEGASVAARDRFGNTALTLAAGAGQNEAVEMLLAAGSRIGHRNLAGSTPLIRAAMNNRVRTVALLLERGADPDVANKKNITALHAAAFNGNAELAGLLLEHGARPDVTDNTGKSPIIYAAARGFVDVVDRLLASGIDANARYGHDLTLLMWAAGHSNDTPETDGFNTVARILDAGADIHATDDRGWTALMIAAERGHAKIAALLLDNGANAAIKDKQGRAAKDLTTDPALRQVLAAAR